jgi:hypothetical protein
MGFGLPHGQIAELSHYHPNSVTNCIRQFKAGGLKDLLVDNRHCIARALGADAGTAPCELGETNPSGTRQRKALAVCGSIQGCEEIPHPPAHPAHSSPIQAIPPPP